MGCLNTACTSRARLLRFTTAYEVCFVLSLLAVRTVNNLSFFSDGVQAAAKFSEIREEDPFCLDGMDVYSNVLYVQINQPELAQLAHKAFEVDKYRVETCCIVGKFYGVVGFIQVYFQNFATL